MNLKLVGIAALLSASLGCAPLKTEDLVGTWVISRASRGNLPAALSGISGKLILSPDGAFLASELPEDLPPMGQGGRPEEPGARLLSGQGKWSVVALEGEQQVQLTFQSMEGPARDEVPYGTQLSIARTLSQETLYFFFGDADEGRRITFERQ
jgi:hypothetical protein